MYTKAGIYVALSLFVATNSLAEANSTSLYQQGSANSATTDQSDITSIHYQIDDSNQGSSLQDSITNSDLNYIQLGHQNNA
ncbi:hypothetical protein ACJJI5_05525 [Microbulbifer sp. EKSA008]|uniref:hypothetical protein n=1 Tax=Microbulbifer sp. EKSA008 TaxID=3243367 RepID=UPI002B2F7D1A|nr:hypothetical protein QT397_22395 [Microbulbifer sp. MKSA007]